MVSTLFCHVLKDKASTHQVVESKLGALCVLCLLVQLLALKVSLKVKIALGHNFVTV
jgi:hypothetical protein